MANIVVKIFQGTTTWTVPTDFGNLVSIECIGAGASGGAARTTLNGVATGGGAGGYSKSVASDLTALTFSIGSVFNVQVGLGGTAVTRTTTGGTVGNVGTDTWFGNSVPSLTNGTLAKGGTGGAASSSTGVQNGGAGGASASGVGSTKNSGGRGGNITSGTASSASGGGGAAGGAGAGNTGVDAASGATNGGSGDAGSGGTAGVTPGGNGGNGAEFGGSDGSGGGGAGKLGTPGGTGGQWGAGGGGAVGLSANATSGAGTNGILVITYGQLPVQSSWTEFLDFFNPPLLRRDFYNPGILTTAVVAQPFINYDFPNPNLPISERQDFQYSNLNPFLGIYPVGLVWDQPNPTLANNTYINKGFTLSGPLYGQPNFPNDWPNPTLGKTDNWINRTWLLSGPLYGRPTSPNDYPNPTLAKDNYTNRTWLLAGPLYGRPVFPNDRPNPTLSKDNYVNRTWLLSGPLYGTPVFPPDFPNPQIKTRVVDLLTQLLGYAPYLPTAVVSIPFFNYDQPNPTLSKIRDVDLLTLLGSYGIYLPTPSLPPSNYDQPNPLSPRTYINRGFEQPSWVAYIPPPPPPTVISTSGRYITEGEVEESIRKAWKYTEDLQTLYRHIAATKLGQKGGLAYARKFKR